MLADNPLPLYGSRYSTRAPARGSGSPSQMLLNDRPLLVCVALWCSRVVIVYLSRWSLTCRRVLRPIRFGGRRPDHDADPRAIREKRGVDYTRRNCASWPASSSRRSWTHRVRSDLIAHYDHAGPGDARRAAENYAFDDHLATGRPGARAALHHAHPKLLNRSSSSSSTRIHHPGPAPAERHQRLLPRGVRSTSS